MRIHNPSITGSLSISGSGLSIDGVGTFSGSVTSTGSFGRVIANSMLVDSGSLLVSGSTPNVYEDGLVKIKQGGQGPGLFVEGGRDANLRLRSTSYRGGIFIDEPGTNTTMGSALVLPGDNTFRLGTNAHYHMTMYSDTGLTTILSDGVDTIILDTDQNAEFAGNVSGSSTSTGSFGKLEVGSQIRLIEGADSFIKGGDFGIGTNTPVARLEIEDDGTSNAMLLKLTTDDTNVYGMVFGNDTFSTTDTDGGQHILSNDGTYIIRTIGSSTTTRIGAGLAYNNYKYLEIDFDSDTAEFTTTKISGSATSTGSFGTVEASHFTGDGAGLTNVPDYVFEPESVLRSLSDVEEFVSESKHLPGIPSMNDMSEWKQYSVGDRDMLLLEKIEELTLYVIRLEKRIKDLENN